MVQKAEKNNIVRDASLRLSWKTVVASIPVGNLEKLLISAPPSFLIQSINVPTIHSFVPHVRSQSWEGEKGGG